MNEAEMKDKYNIDEFLYQTKKDKWVDTGKFLVCDEHDCTIFNNGKDYCPICITECIIRNGN